MRPELEQIEKIEQYLRNELSANDKAAFEKQMTADSALREEVRLQQEIMNGIDRSLLKEKVQLAGRRFKFQQNFTKWGLGGLGAIAILAVVFFYYTNKSGNQKAFVLPEFNEQGEKLWADADKHIPSQTFVIDASKDTVIETKGGIVMAIAANSFLDENNNAASGEVNLIVREALDPATMVTGGLSTRSGNDLLESGGMFYLDARKDDKSLKIDPAKAIYTEVPTDSLKPGMQLFSGKRLDNGTIDWVNPKPLERDLVAVDIQSLDFYPPHYLDSLLRWGYDIKDKKFTDSLYYSFAWLFSQRPKADSTAVAGPESKPISESDYITLVEPKKKSERIASDTIPRVQAKDSLLADIGTYTQDIRHYFIGCGINPAKIKAIWNDQFQNTILATREFEERLRWIHEAGSPEALDLYVNNLDKSLAVIDSMAARKLFGKYKDQFLVFAARQEGKVKNGSPQFQLLKKYYENKTRAFTDAIAKTQNEFWNKQAQLDNEAARKRNEHGIDSVNRIAQNFQEEFELNLKDAYRQLGYDTTIRRGNREAYRLEVTQTGWNNVDKYVYESTITRTTLNYTDPQTGKKAVINYLPFSVQVEQWSEYERLYVYLLPDKLSSFMRLNGEEGKYIEKLDELMQYKLVCIAFKDEQAYFYSYNRVESKDYTGISLTAIDKDELNQQLNSIGNQTQASGIVKENEFFQFEAKNYQRRQDNLKRQDLYQKVLMLIFRCNPEFADSIKDDRPIINKPGTSK